MTTPHPAGEGIRRFGATAWNLLGALLLIGAIIWVLSKVAFLLPAVVLALAIIYVLNPVVSKLQERGVARWIGSCLSYLLVLGFFTLLGFLIIPSLADQGRELANDFPTIYDDLAVDLESFIDRIGFDVDIPDYEELREGISDGQESFFEDRLEQITDVTLSVLETLLLIILAPVVAFYVLLDLPTQRDNTRHLIPERYRAELAHLTTQLGTAVGGFLRGQLLVALIVGLMTSIGFRIIDLPFWLLIGLIAGFLNIIPFIGPWVGGFLGVAIALATRDLQTAVWAGLVALIVQQIDNHFVSPTVLRATVHIHPAAIILGLIAGGTLGGFWGLLLAVPLMASFKIIAGHYWRTRILGQSWEQASEALIVEHPTGETLIARLRRVDGGGSADDAADEDPEPPVDGSSPP